MQRCTQAARRSCADPVYRLENWASVARMATTILLIRHGQTEWNRVERFRGRADIPLNNTGKQQAEATGRRVAAQWQPVAVYSSPLSRAVNTAEAIGRHVNLSVEIHPGLVDIDYRDWQALTPDEVRAIQSKSALKQFRGCQQVYNLRLTGNLHLIRPPTLPLLPNTTS